MQFFKAKARLFGYLALVAGLGVAGAPGQAQAPDDPWFMPAAQRAAQFAAFHENTRRTVVEFQPFRATLSGLAGDGTPLALTALNPAMNAWFVLETGAGSGARVWHLENAAPGLFRVSLSTGDNPALLIEAPEGRITCRPWEGELDEAARSGLPYAPLCEQALFLRNRVSGARTTREAVADFLRGYVPFGESLITLVKDTLYEDAWLQTSEVIDEGEAGAVVASLGQAHLSRHPVMRSNLRVDLIGTEAGRMEAGSWYAVQDAPGIYASTLQPGMVHPDILNRRGEANALDGVENNADVALFAFDLSRFELGYETGTDHPAVNWSPRPSARDSRLPGPDGFGTLEPLAMTGTLNPVLAERVAAIFAGGFKREHGAFRRGPMSTSNHGHHYGVMVQGVVLSRLQPGLATLFNLDDGSIHMRTWHEDDRVLLPRIRFARQNGVPVIEPHAETGEGVPGALVRDWGQGNWSGSAEAQLRTLRAGACLRRADGRDFLLYAVFSSATPSGMARVFQAYGCDYAMLLDMNSLDLTYAAIYTRQPGVEGFSTVHLDRRMGESDSRTRDGRPIARFVQSADNRDFIYLLRRQGRE